MFLLQPVTLLDNAGRDPFPWCRRTIKRTCFTVVLWEPKGGSSAAIEIAVEGRTMHTLVQH